MFFPHSRRPSHLFLDPGDRFIPTRSLMDIERAQCLLTPTKNKRAPGRSAISPSRDAYIRKVDENLTLESGGKPFRMLQFKGSPRKLKESEDGNQESEHRRRTRPLPKCPEFILDAPELSNDYYLNLIDWGENNILAAALGNSVYIRDAKTHKVQLLLKRYQMYEFPTSVAWSNDGTTLAIGFNDPKIEIWDAAALCLKRKIYAHKARIGSLSWNGHIISSGSRDSYIYNHDLRAPDRTASYYKGHGKEVCGLKWSENGKKLASGGEDSLVNVWESTNTSKCLYRFKDHTSSVKALAWCPFDIKLLASGGGTYDRCLKIWNIQLGSCVNSIDTDAQICGLVWNRHQKEIVTGHGYKTNKLSLWSYPSLSHIENFYGHTGRILHLSQNPEGSTVVSASSDETLRFWKLFSPPLRNGRDCDSPVALHGMHIR